MSGVNQLMVWVSSLSVRVVMAMPVRSVRSHLVQTDLLRQETRPTMDVQFQFSRSTLLFSVQKLTKFRHHISHWLSENRAENSWSRTRLYTQKITIVQVTNPKRFSLHFSLRKLLRVSPYPYFFNLPQRYRFCRENAQKRSIFSSR